MTKRRAPTLIGESRKGLTKAGRAALRRLGYHVLETDSIVRLVPKSRFTREFDLSDSAGQSDLQRFIKSSEANLQAKAERTRIQTLVKATRTENDREADALAREIVAEAWLANELENGPADMLRLCFQGIAAGFTFDEIWTARCNLKVETISATVPARLWQLPKKGKAGNG